MFSKTLYVLLVANAHNIHTHGFCQVHAKPKLDSTALVKYVKVSTALF